MTQPIQSETQAAPTLDEEADELIRNTAHIGKRYANGIPNNCHPSTVEGALEMLDVLLGAYQGSPSR